MAHMERERILIISHSYTPFLNPRAFRWSAIAEIWAAQGLKVDVITSWTPGLKRCEISNGVEIHRISGNVIERLRSLLRPKSRATTADDSSRASKSHEGFLSQIIAWILAAAKCVNDKVWKNVYWPDYACLWIVPAAAKALELFEMEKYGTVISVSDPVSSHLVGKKVKSVYHDIKWIVDIGDPFCFREDTPPNNYRLYDNLNIRSERKIFGLADSISVTCQPTATKYSQMFPEFKDKIVVIPPLLSMNRRGKVATPFFHQGSKIRLLYVGTLYRAIRSPKFLLTLFEQLLEIMPHEEIELHFIGGNDECVEHFQPYARLLDKNIFLHGLLGRNRVTQAMEEADVLVNIGNHNRYQLPSKVVEYVSQGKPILNLTTIEDDSSRDFFAGYPAMLNLHDHGKAPSEQAVKGLKEFINKLPFNIDQNYLAGLKKRFQVDTISAAYAGLVSGVREPVAAIDHRKLEESEAPAL